MVIAEALSCSVPIITLEYKYYGYRSVAAKTVELYEWILNKGEKPDFII